MYKFFSAVNNHHSGGFMEKNNSEKWAKIKTFFKKNGYYFLIVLCIGAVATMVGVAVSQSKKGQDANISIVDDSQSTIVGEQEKPQDGEEEKPSEPDEPAKPTEPEKEKAVFTVPVSGTVLNEYSASSVFYNQSLNKYQTHEAMDFVSETDSNVYASSNGKVKEIDYNMLDGYYVVLEHEDGIVTKYCSLSGETTLKVGDTVKGGDVIETMSDSMGSECLDGVHLHFEVYRNGELINPLEVLVLNEK